MTICKFKKQKGFILLTAILIMAILLLIATYVTSFTMTEFKIASSQSTATKTYYLAEAGINEMLWKIQNDPATGLAFTSGILSSINDIDRNNIFNDENASYQVAAINTVPAEAWIIATSTYQIGGSVSQRVVKSYVSRATYSGQDWDFGVFAGGRGSQQNGNFVFTGAGIVLVANGGRLHANQVFKVQGAEVVVNDGSVTASNVINVVAGGKLTLNNSTRESPTTTIDMLQIDFNSADPNSWKNRATVTYTKTQFKNLPDNTTLNGIIYVTGEAEITDKNLTINGVLVAEEDIKITLAGKTLTVNAGPAYGGGLLAKEDIEITTSGGVVVIDGLVYAAADLEITSSGTNFTINGSLTGFDAKVTASGGAIILNYEPENFRPVIDPEYNPSSPIIQIDHWEEQY
ncbi:MAG: PilX N-terminal domain-containing pilus assembly protein [Patescibacteria group bacterium]